VAGAGVKFRLRRNFGRGRDHEYCPRYPGNLPVKSPLPHPFSSYSGVPLSRTQNAVKRLWNRFLRDDQPASVIVIVIAGLHAIGFIIFNDIQNPIIFFFAINFD
jgi:hypothetical protein